MIHGVCLRMIQLLVERVGYAASCSSMTVFFYPLELESEILAVVGGKTACPTSTRGKSLTDCSSVFAWTGFACLSEVLPKRLQGKQ